MMTLETIRGAWQRKGVVGHCPVCHRREWNDHGEVSLPSVDGEDVRTSAMRCGHCGVMILVSLDG